ncbi:portal protein [Cronobacter phage ESP2949-1]|uniref:Portal protein n=1 Tax=Cronobacter phage ESP2949-1 TaxID=2920894 RepID=G1CSR5_9CAUD|nr:portal protein [Cronobacter phage ESP2949-1]AEM24772.1 portal protein [Cronobacter phage ESP2949-1]
MSKPELVKEDSYESTFKGGDGRKGLAVISPLLQGSTLSKLYAEDDIARRIVDVVPEEMISAGFQIDGVGDEDDFRSYWDEIRVEQQITDALCWSRLFGGAAIVALINDRRALTSPAVPGAKRIEGIRVYDRTQIKVKSRVTNARSMRYGEPEIYTVMPGGEVTDYDVHYTRVHLIDGERLPNGERKKNDGWGASVLTKRLVEAIEDYNECQKLATEILRRKQQAVWKAQNLAQLCEDDDGRSAARLRLAQVDDNSGVGRAIGIDANDEDYVVLNSDVSGVQTILQEKMDRIVALSGIHEIILKNKNTGGVSASQNTALETFHKLVDRKRNDDYLPVLEFLLPFIVQEKDWSIIFNPLSKPSDKDNAEILGKNVESLGKAVSEQMITVDEARDTIRAIAPQIKLSKSNNVTFEENEEEDPVEPEPDLEMGE